MTCPRNKCNGHLMTRSMKASLRRHILTIRVLAICERCGGTFAGAKVQSVGDLGVVRSVCEGRV